MGLYFSHQTRLTRVLGNFEDSVQPITFRDRVPDSGPKQPPLTFRFTVQVEGTDFPFFTRQEFSDPFARAAERRRLRRLVSAGNVFPIPTALLSAAVETVPLRIFRPQAVPDGWRKKAQTQATRAADPGFHPNPTISIQAPETAYSVTACQLVEEIQRHLLENRIDGGQTWSLWSEAEVLSSLIDRLNRFNQLTGIIRTRTSISLGVNQNTGTLPTDYMQLRRAVWHQGSTRSVLTVEDPFELDHAAPGWQTATGTPVAVIKEPLEKETIKIYPLPTVAGTLELVYVPSLTADLDSCAPLPIPAIFTPFIKWGVISDLLSKEGEANEPERATYAEGRFDDGIELARALFGTDR